MSLRIAFDCDGVVADLDSALAEIVTRLFGEAPPDRSPKRGQNRPRSRRSPRSRNQSARRPRVRPSRTRFRRLRPLPSPPPTPRPALALRPPTRPPPTARPTRKSRPHPPASARSPAASSTTCGRRSATPRTSGSRWQETEPGIVARLAQLARERRWEVIFITQRPSSAGDTTQLQTQRWLVAHGFDLPSVYVIKGTRGKVAEALSLDIVVDDRPENCLDVKLESRARAILVWNDDLANLPPNARRLGIEPVTSLGACLDLLAEVPRQAAKPGLFQRLHQSIP